MLIYITICFNFMYLKLQRNKYLDSYTKHDFTNQQPLFDDFIDKFEQVAVYDCHHNIDPCILEDVHVSKYNDNKFSIYPITAYGSLMCCLGRDFGFHMNRPIFDFISEKSKEIITKINNDKSNPNFDPTLPFTSMLKERGRSR